MAVESSLPLALEETAWRFDEHYYESAPAQLRLLRSYLRSTEHMFKLRLRAANYVHTEFGRGVPNCGVEWDWSSASCASGFISSILGGIFGPGDDPALPDPTPEQTRSTFHSVSFTPDCLFFAIASSPRLGPSSPFLASPVPTEPAAKAPSHKINGGAIAGGIVGAVIVIGAAIALFLRRRFRRRSVPEEILPTSAGPGSPLQKQVLSFNVTTGEQTLLAIDSPITHSVVEPEEAILPAITGWHRRYQRVNWSDRDESRSQSIAGPAASGTGAALEMQMRAMAERMALMETQLQMRSLAEEQPPGYTAARTPVNNYDQPASPDTGSSRQLSYFQED
ncbi:hypothetical protein GGX14DRAFT_399746 [Mycena pura]|uniref:Uncharacterized protein n=1 Tax=Mycena pura TaxID=153505 RepID=A0AAD6Y6G3_9AGAR|nr:hypothetical protein GGX14DRAFT_399746 [Mycena pura]